MGTFLTLDERRRKTLRLLSQYAESLPVLPAIVSAVLAVPRTDPTLPDRIEALARLDPALAVRLLFVANHTFNFSADRDVTLSSIMALAGADAVVASVERLSEARPAFVSVRAQQELWLHSIQVAMAAKYLCQMLPEPRPSGEEAYLYGLLHDLGRLVMLVTSPSKVEEINERHWVTGHDLVALEQEICGFDHSVLGWLACRNWNFPDALAFVNKLHHAPPTDPSQSLPRRTTTLVMLISLADELSLLITQDSVLLHEAAPARLKILARSKIGPLAQALGLPLSTVEQFIGPLDAVSKARLGQVQPALATQAQQASQGG